MSIFKLIARRMPDLKIKLIQSRMFEEPEHYVKKTFSTALFLTFGILIVAFTFVKKPGVIILAPIIFLFAFSYFLRYVDVKITKITRSIDQEIIFAGRFLIIELQSGVPLYNAFINLGRNYKVIGPFFDEIVEKVNLGTTMEEAMNEAIINTPSPDLRKLMWQVLNSMRTGADVADSLNAVIDQIVRQQQIAVKEYGRKLNPLAMFYMMIAVIVPSLGTTVLIVLATFLGFPIPLPFLLIMAGMVGFVQFMFFAIIKSARPPMEL
ncbi:MAG: type II secretion system F family protein [Nanoarchaeota archaeon]|nr:type II secretion system F family protein [Nanoarchaeota archaeon]MBU1320942.1 type II secretion system F family protein [Nanoarchaeota archaeon]MBU1597391.1 type II secretion system F family protein [Nanoarchaeota archaeon]MBU2441854.1 type II secretion system F family protein [Nanoarchaeota archaeon]